MSNIDICKKGAKFVHIKRAQREPPCCLFRHHSTMNVIFVIFFFVFSSQSPNCRLCTNGVCTYPDGLCSCNDGWRGENCNIKIFDLPTSPEIQKFHPENSWWAILLYVLTAVVIIAMAAAVAFYCYKRNNNAEHQKERTADRRDSQHSDDLSPDLSL